MPVISFANIKFKGLSRDILLKDDPFLKIVVTMNAELIVRANTDPTLGKIVNFSYATFDGRIPDFLARIKSGKNHFEKISGSDFIFDVCEHAAQRGERVFLLGGLEESNRLAVKKLQDKYGVKIAGHSPEYMEMPFPEDHNQKILETIKKFRPQYLFVGFGALKQEMWIQSNRTFLESLGVKIAVGSGGTFEFVSGMIKRAPRFIQRIGLEGIYRFLQEPKLFRLKRIFYSFKIFLYA